jgi:hypothetical protein
MGRPPKSASSDPETADALRQKAETIRQFASLLTPKTRAAALHKAGEFQRKADRMEASGSVSADRPES